MDESDPMETIGQMKEAIDSSTGAPNQSGNSDKMLKRSRRWTIAAALLLVIGPMLYTAARHEVSRWYHAAAKDATYNDDHATSLQKIIKAREWNPGDPNLSIEEVGAYLRVGQADKAASVSDHFLESSEQRYAMMPTKPNEFELAAALNQSAYSHALANTDLEQALKNVERSIRLRGGLPSGSIDTRGYLHHLLGNKDQAVKDTELAVAGFEAALQRQKTSVRQEAQFFVDKTPLEYAEKQLNETHAVLLHHRGLAYEAAGRAEEAKEDFEKAKELGYSPENGVW